MKYPLLTLLFGYFMLPGPLMAQEGEKLIFRYRCVPTSTTDYSVEISRDSFVLNSTEKLPDRKSRHVKKLVTSNYTHSFNPGQKTVIDSIISLYKLDSAGLYQRRTTEWGTLWQVEIQRNAITHTISLPNYNNAGLEALIRFIACLIPKKERPLFECKKCG